MVARGVLFNFAFAFDRVDCLSLPFPTLPKLLLLPLSFPFFPSLTSYQKFLAHSSQGWKSRMSPWSPECQHGHVLVRIVLWVANEQLFLVFLRARVLWRLSLFCPRLSLLLSDWYKGLTCTLSMWSAVEPQPQCGLSFIGALVPFLRGLPPLRYSILNALPPNNITLKVKISTYKFWGTHTFSAQKQKDWNLDLQCLMFATVKIRTSKRGTENGHQVALGHHKNSYRNLP